MGYITFIISLILLLFSIKENRGKIVMPQTVFFLLWTFVLFLSILNLFNIIKPTPLAYFLILLMLTFFYIGNILANKKCNFIKLNEKLKRKLYNFKNLIYKIRERFSKNPKYTLIYILSILLIVFTIIDCIIVVQNLLDGVPMYKIRRWRMGAFGIDSNPILDRRSFMEEVFRSTILAPFETIITPIAAYSIFNTKEKKKHRYALLIIAILVLVLSSIAGGGGRLGFIYFFGCFFLAFLLKIKENDKFNIKKYSKYIVIILVLGLISTIFMTQLRTSQSFIKQLYTYFALPPTLLSLWLPKLKTVEHTYGLLTFFGIHSYVFRAFDAIGLDFLIPQIYNETFKHVLNTEIFHQVGYGVANAFVTPIYYFFIDGGIPFVCIFSMLFGFIIKKSYNSITQNMDLKNFTLYALIIYGTFLTFIRIQTAIPSYIISIALAIILLDVISPSNKKTLKKKINKKSKNEDLISVVIPVYKVEDYLERCIKSILVQSYSNLEIILIDDGSPDSCGEICDNYKKKDRRIKVIHKKNGGLSEARNAGISIATGKYITFIDSDDYVDENYVELLYETLVKYSADMAIGSHRVIYDTNRIINKETKEEYCGAPNIIIEKMLYDDGIDLSAWAKLYKTTLFKKIKYPVGRVFEDAATTYKLIYASNKIAVNSQAIYNYVIRTNSISGTSFNEKKLDLIISTKEMTDYVRKINPELSKACDRRLMYAYLSTLTQLAKSDKKNKKIQEELTNYINKNKFSILKNPRVPKRDKIGICSLTLGFDFYRFMWNCYSKISKRS